MAYGMMAAEQPRSKKAYYDAGGQNIAPWMVNRAPSALAAYLRNYEQSYRLNQGAWNPAGAYYDQAGQFKVPGINA